MQDRRKRKLFWAAYHGRLSEVNQFISEGVDVNWPCPDASHATAVCAAVERGYIEVFEALIAANARVDLAVTFPSGHRYMLLHVAAKENRKAIAKRLVDLDSNLYIKSNRGYLPLSLAIRYNNKAIATFLLKTMIKKAGLPVNAAGEMMPLPEDKNIYSFIIEALNDEKSKTAYDKHSRLRDKIRACLAKALTKKVTRLIEENNLENLQAELIGLKAIQSQVNLLQGKGGLGKKEDKKTAVIKIEVLIEDIKEALSAESQAQKRIASEEKLLSAAEHGRLAEVQALVASGVNVNCVDKYFLTPLLYAAYGNHQAIFDFLTEKGAGVDSRSNNRQRFYSAVKSGYVLVMRALLSTGVTFNPAKHWEDKFQLYYAVKSGSADGVKVLLEAGAKLEYVEVSARHGTLLSVAVIDGCAKVAEILLAAGANVYEVLGSDENSLLHVACGYVHPEIGENYKAVFEVLVKSGADINKRNKHDHTPLDRAAMCGSYPIVKFLVDNGVNLREQRQLSPLGCAINNYVNWKNYQYEATVPCLLDGMIQQAGLPVDEAGKTIYSFVIDVLNGERSSAVFEKHDELRESIRTTLDSALTAKMSRLIQENNRDNLEAELAGLVAITSQVKLLQGTGGRLGFFAEKTAMTQIKGLIEQLRDMLGLNVVPVVPLSRNITKIEQAAVSAWQMLGLLALPPAPPVVNVGAISVNNLKKSEPDAETFTL